MKKLLITTSLISLLALSSPTVFAYNQDNKHNNYSRHNNNFEDTARVTHVEPIYETIRVPTSYRECSPRSHRNNTHQQKSYTSTIAGGLVGGVIGNQFGGGSGKKIMTAAGALLGGSIGRDLNPLPQSYSQYNRVDNCRTTERYQQKERINGYYVTYRYQGKTYTSEMDEHPGKYIPVEVSVRPARPYY